jgi:carboxymethylenebutenolidase
VPVAETDPSITIERAQLRRLDGIVNAYAAYPKSVRGNTPGIVVIMDEWGVDAPVRETVRRTAKFGFTCIAADLYSRMNAPNGDGVTDEESVKPFAARLTRKQYAGDLRAAALHLLSKAPNCKIGVMGFGLGGHLALLQAIDNGDLFDAVAPFYGATADVNPTDIHIPVCGSYGEKDLAVPPDEIRAWRSVLRVGNEVRIYPSAGHGFFDEARSSFVASAADDAWKRTMKFFKDTLGLETP